MKVSVIIPTMNEEKYIAKTINRIKKLGKYEIIVVDKSSDKTAEVAKSLGARVIKQKSRGKGNAMRMGAKHAKGEILVFVDGDDSYEVEKIPELINLLKYCNIIYGFRIFKKQQLIRFIGDKVANFLIKLRGMYTPDLLTGFYAIRKKDFEKLKTKENEFGIETEIFIKAHNLSYSICGIFTKHINRKDSKMSVMKSLRIPKLIIFGVNK